MIQTIDVLQLFGLLILGIGIALIIAGIMARQGEAAQSDGEVHRNSKGVILIGPIPIVWGFGRRGWLIASAVCVIIFLIWIIALL